MRGRPRNRRSSYIRWSERTGQRAARPGPGTLDDAPTETEVRASERVGRAERGPPVRLSDVLQIFAGLETNGPSGRDAYFFPGSRVTADAALARLDLKDPEPAQLDPLAALHGGPHRIEDRVDGHLSFDFGDVRDFRNLVDDVDLDHA